MTSWDKLQPKFRRFCLERGDKTIRDIADELHVGRATVFRLMNGHTKQPCRTLQDAVSRVVWEESQVRPSDTDGKEG